MTKEERHQYYLQHREERLVKENQYRRDHDGRSRYQDYYRDNRDKVLAQRKLSDLKNPGKLREIRRRTWAKRRERMKIYRKQRSIEHPELGVRAALRITERNTQTLLSATQHGQVWLQREIQYLLDHIDAPAQMVAMVLGRSLRAVYSRRAILRQTSKKLTSDQPSVS